MTPDLAELAEALIEVARLAQAALQTCDVKTELLPVPHQRPKKLPKGSQAVYAFLLGTHCLKVGKAGPKTQARFTSHHYGENALARAARTGSALAPSPVAISFVSCKTEQYQCWTSAAVVGQ